MTQHTSGKLSVKQQSGEIQLWATEVNGGVTTTSCVALTNGFPNDLAQADAARLVACWNACNGIPTYQLTAEGGAPTDLGGTIDNLRSTVAFLEAQERDTITQVEWLERANTLHRQVEMLYVVDGYEVQLTWDGTPISEAFHGETLSDAISKAQVSFDLDAKSEYLQGNDPQARQLQALEAQRDALLDVARSAAAIGFHTMPKNAVCMCTQCELVRDVKAAIASVTGVKS